VSLKILLNEPHGNHRYAYSSEDALLILCRTPTETYVCRVGTFGQRNELAQEEMARAYVGTEQWDDWKQQVCAEDIYTISLHPHIWHRCPCLKASQRLRCCLRAPLDLQRTVCLTTCLLL
jgi:hypothetical protein